jgi:hypothetical protein
MMTTNEMAVYLLNNAIKQTYSCSYEMKIIEAKEIALNQLAVAKMFLFDACILDSKHCKKTLYFIAETKTELEKLNNSEV